MIHVNHIMKLSFLLALLVLTTGCPYVPGDPTQSADYAAGFAVGFLEDDWYWDGFDDSYDTVDGGDIYYDDSEIPYIEESTYDAGYWDGVWQAYNDGYFVAYDYAFTIGFSEGYDAAYAADYLAFLNADEHTEWDDGGWTDGYNDGFSEGRVFGANDFETGLSFDWLDALLDYRSGTDLIFEEIGVGTGTLGPVNLYVYGTDPAAVKAAGDTMRGSTGKGRSIRRTEATTKAEKFEEPDLSYRTLTDEFEEAFDVVPGMTTRGNRALTLTTSRLQRLNAYIATLE